MPTTKATQRRDVSTEIAYLTRALKAPTLRESVSRLADRARAENWSHEEYLAACLQREVSARESHGGEGRIRAARFPARKSLEEFDFEHARGLKRDTIAHLGTLDFITARDNVVFLGPAWHREDSSCGRPGDTRVSGRSSGAVRHRRRMGSTGSPRLTTPGASTPNSPGFAAIRSWWLTKSATFRLSPRPPTSSSSWCPPGMSGPA